MPESADSADDLQRRLLDYGIQVMHFAGLANAKRLSFLKPDRHPEMVRNETIVRLFETLTNQIRLVILNACYTETLAQQLAQHIDCVVGMGRQTNDQIATTLSASYYHAVTSGQSVQAAFDLAYIPVETEQGGGHTVPRLKVRTGVNASDVVLIVLSGRRSPAGSAFDRPATTELSLRSVPSIHSLQASVG